MTSFQLSPSSSSLSTEEIEKTERLLLARALREQEKRASRTRLLRYRPYNKQAEFHAAGADHRERLLMAGNQLGKTYSGAAEAAYHLTGLYPANWQGRVFTKPVQAWAGSETLEVTRDGVQRLLVGPPRIEAEWGSGLIPADKIIDTNRKQGVADALDSVVVKHVSGGTSVLGFKAYDQGRTKWQGETLDFVWFDEGTTIRYLYGGCSLARMQQAVWCT